MYILHFKTIHKKLVYKICVMNAIGSEDVKIMMMHMNINYFERNPHIEKIWFNEH